MSTCLVQLSDPYLHTFTSPFPRIKMVRGGHRRHIPEPVKGTFCYHVSSNVLKRHIDLVYLALVYATNKHMPELHREPNCSIVSQSAVREVRDHKDDVILPYIDMCLITYVGRSSPWGFTKFDPRHFFLILEPPWSIQLIDHNFNPGTSLRQFECSNCANFKTLQEKYE